MTGEVSADGIRRYMVNGREGQIMALHLHLPLANGPITLDVRYPDGSLIPNGSRVLTWEGPLPDSGDYQVDVKSPHPAEYTLQISVN